LNIISSDYFRDWSNLFKQLFLNAQQPKPKIYIAYYAQKGNSRFRKGFFTELEMGVGWVKAITRTASAVKN